MFPRIDKGPIEYTLQIGAAFNTERQRACTRFLFNTTEEFHHFRYEISIDVAEENGILRFAMKGLKTRGMGMPAAGYAERIVDLFDLTGPYEVIISKPGDIVTTFGVHVKKDTVTITRAPDGDSPFITVVSV